MYEAFYKLSGNPFELNPDPDFYFASRGHSRAFAYLKYGIYQGDGFIVVTGDIGAGKTTMLRTLLQELDTEQILAAQLVSTHLDADDLLQAVCTAFGLTVKNIGKAELLAQFESFLGGLADAKRRALLVVDEAQNLTPRAMEELRMLSNFQRAGRPLLQSFLVGQPELREILRTPAMTQLRQRVIASYHLGPMGRDDTRAYVLHRLECVGWNADPKIEEIVFNRLFEATGGLPRRINAVCNRLLLGAYMGRKHLVGEAELAETVNEMRAEIGPESRQVAPVLSPDATGGPARAFQSAALMARLERIEKSVAQAVDILQQLAPPEGKPAAASAPAPAAKARPRFGARSGG
jgi:putative secretion ATPase (PEP-CTERM system associated)